MKLRLTSNGRCGSEYTQIYIDDKPSNIGLVELELFTDKGLIKIRTTEIARDENGLEIIEGEGEYRGLKYIEKVYLVEDADINLELTQSGFKSFVQG